MTKYTSVLLVLLISMAAFAAPARADDDGRRGEWRGDWHRHWHGDWHRDFHGWREGYWRHGYHEGHLGWWWIVAGTWYFYPQPVYPYPVPAPAPVIVAPTTLPSVPPPTQYWYYCDAAKGYYPYVASCPSGWREVPAVPAGTTTR